MKFILQIIVCAFYAASQSSLEVMCQSFDDSIEIYLTTPLHVVIGCSSYEIFLQQRSSIMIYLVKSPL